MRFFTIGVMLLGLAATACDRGQTASAASGSAAAAGAATAGATSGAGDASNASSTRSVTIPAGTQLPITLDTTVGSDISRVEQAVVAHLTHPVVIHGDTVLPAGSRVGGVVTDATRSGKVKGRAHVAVRFDSIVSGAGEESSRYRIETTAVGRTAESTKKKDALEIGAPAAGGALIGAIAGGKKGALIGTAVGGGAGTAVVLSTRGKEIRLPKGTALTLRLTEPLTVKMKA